MFELHDVGALINDYYESTSTAGPMFRTGVLLEGSHLSLANEQEQNHLRTYHNVRTVLNLQPLPQARFRLARTATGHVPERFSAEDVLGLRWCRLNLRLGPYTDSHMKDMPYWQKW